MNYGELKQKIIDLGFEDEGMKEEYQSVLQNACNLSIQQIYDDLVIQLTPYYKRELSTPDKEWEPTRPKLITDQTLDTEEIGLPENLLELLPLLCAYFVWLDDDNIKSTYYWNIYDQFRERIIGSCIRTVKARITGGF